MNSKHWPWLVTAFLTLIFWLHTCNLQKKVDQGREQITQLDLDKQTLTTKINEQGQDIFIQQSIIRDNMKSLDDLTDTIFNLKKVDSKNRETIAYFKNTTKTGVTKVDVPYLDSTAMKAFEDSVTKSCPDLASFVRDSVLTVPVSARITDPNFEVGLTVKKQGVTIDSLVIPDTLQLRFVEHKRGLFKSNEIETQFFHSNPLVRTTGANSAFYKPKKASFFKRVILPVAVGIGAGLLIPKL